MVASVSGPAFSMIALPAPGCSGARPDLAGPGVATASLLLVCIPALRCGMTSDNFRSGESSTRCVVSSATQQVARRGRGDCTHRRTT